MQITPRSAALLSVMTISIWSSQETFAQLGGLMVTVNEPATGTTVGGTTPVNATPGTVGSLTVVAVQFTLDGTDLGGEDVEAPYSIAWDTRTASNGPHTLQAIARDALGTRWTSDAVAVTVFNDTTPPTVGIVAPADGATVSATIDVQASASDNVGVAGVQFSLDGAPLGAEDTTAPYAVSWDTRTATDGAHTMRAIARDAAGHSTISAPVNVTVDNHRSFRAGDVLVSLEQGPILWFLPDGTPHETLTPGVVGVGEGMGWDSQGNLYISRWCSDNDCLNGNTVEKFNTTGRSEGAVGSDYNCAPHTIVFDPTDIAYVGEAGCRKAILKFMPRMASPVVYTVAEDFQGVFWLDLAPDRCTLFYTSYGPNVKRFDVCSGVQLPDFNLAPVPGGIAHDLRVMSDGGVLVATGTVISLLDSTGALVRTYQGPAEENTYWIGLDLVGDGTFWVGNYYTSNVYRIDLTSGAILDSFNTQSPPQSIVGVRVKR
jgi:hypothetical protein